MPNEFIVAFRDFDGDRQETSFPVLDTAVVANWTTFIGALEAWTIGAGAGGGFYDEESVDSGNASTNPAAQNSLQLMIEVRDLTTGRIYTHRVPCVDLGKAADGGTNAAWVVANGVTTANPLHADYATFATAVSNYLQSKIGAGNAVELVRMYVEDR